MVIGSAFDSKGIQRAARVFDPCSTAAEQPQAASVVEVTGIPRPVPWTAVHGEFGLVVTISMKVARQNVNAANHNLTCHPRRQAGRREFRSGVWADRYAPLVSQDSKLDGWHWMAGEETPPGEHSGHIFNTHRVVCDLRNRFSFSGAVDCGDLGLWSYQLQLAQQSREDRRAAAEDLPEARKGQSALHAVIRQAFQERRRGNGARGVVSVYLLYKRGGIDATRAPQIGVRYQTCDAGREIGQNEYWQSGQIDLARRQSKALFQYPVLGHQKAMGSHGRLGLAGAATGEGEQRWSLRCAWVDLFIGCQAIGAGPPRGARHRDADSELNRDVSQGR